MAKVRLLDPTDAKRKLDRYELIGELASGGMATVFLGRLGGVGGFQRFVAIKRLHPHLASEEEFIEMFLDEARLAAGIHHPHVVPILEVGQSDSGYYLVMEYVEGDTLARLMARSLAKAQPIPRPVLIRVVLDALAGLHAAHELVDPQGSPVHLVHRDVSPQNVLVGVDGCSRITDFGVAHAASRLQNTRADRLKGKLAYMSPEQARAGDVDRRADVFAMGIILWEVLAARRLFKADSEAITLQRITIEPIPRLSQALPGVHPSLDCVCAKALERDRDHRFLSAAEMAEALERAAREAAHASTTDLGVASPREVAAYVQSALGEDIAAQRDSVRAWLAHSEPSMPKLSGVKPGEARGASPRAVASVPQAAANPGAAGRPPGYDVTMKIPLDRPASSYVGRPRDGTPPPAAAQIDALAPEGGPTPMPASAPAYDPSRGSQPDLAPVATPRPPSAPRLDIVPEPLDETPVEPMADDDDEHETLLMDCDAAKAAIRAAKAGQQAPTPTPAPAPVETPAPAPSSGHAGPFSEDGTTPSKSIEAFHLPPAPPPSRTPQIVALSVGCVVAALGVVVFLVRGNEQTPPPAPAASGVHAPPPSPSAAPAPAPPPPTATPTATVTAVEATPVSALPPADPPKLGKGPLPKPKPTSRPAERPAPSPVLAPAPEPAPDPDMTNPYKPKK